MSDEQKYQELLKEIGRILKEKNDQICIQAFQISDLKKQLKDAEEKITELSKKEGANEWITKSK